MINAITHIVDDDGFGGVNRMLDFMTKSPSLQNWGHHGIVRVQRGQLAPPRIAADIIVSHLSINWANMPMLTAIRAMHPQTPVIHVEHSYSERFATSNVRNRWRFDTLLHTAYSLFDTIVAVSRPQHDWMLRKRYCNPDHLVCIPSVVDLAPFFAVADPDVRSRFVLGAFGRLHVQKGFDILIEGFNAAARPDVELHIYGDGEESDRLRKLSAGNPRIVFRGYVENTADAMAMCDAVAMPSRWEPFGLVALEAMAAGRPLLCSRIDGLRQHIANGAIDIGDNTALDWGNMLRQLNTAAICKPADNRETARRMVDQFIDEWRKLCQFPTDRETVSRAA